MKFRLQELISFAAIVFTTVCFFWGGYSFWSQGSWVTSAVFVLCGLLFLLWSFLLLVKTLMGLSEGEKEELRTAGRKVMATYSAMDRRWNVSENGQSPVVVYAKVVDPVTGKERVFQSDDLWLSGEGGVIHDGPVFQAWQTLQRADAAKTYRVPVYIDPKNPKRYFMDVAGVEVG